MRRNSVFAQRSLYQILEASIKDIQADSSTEAGVKNLYLERLTELEPKDFLVFLDKLYDPEKGNRSFILALQTINLYCFNNLFAWQNPVLMTRLSNQIQGLIKRGSIQFEQERLDRITAEKYIPRNSQWRETPEENAHKKSKRPLESSGDESGKTLLM